MHIVDWGEAQEVDTLLAACHQWLKTHKDILLPKRDALLKQYLGCHAEMEEGHALFCMRNSLVLNKGLMYVSTMPKGEAEEILAFVVRGEQCWVALNGIHHDAGHQGQQRMLALVHEHFWWPMMVKDCHALVRGCQWCCAFEGVISKVPLCPIQAHAPFELVHVDFTSVESTMELNKPPCVKNVLVITDHFTHYALAMVIKDHTARTIVGILYERFMAVFGVPTKILSNCGANVTSTLVEELCTAFGIQKCRTMAYHAQCNGQVECFHRTLFHMIGKLASDKKAHWKQHLPKLVQAYNSTQSMVTGYSPHYLMFGRHLHLPIDFYFLTMGTHVHTCHVPVYVVEVRECFKEAYTEAHSWTNSEAEWQK